MTTGMTAGLTVGFRLDFLVKAEFGCRNPADQASKAESFSYVCRVEQMSGLDLVTCKCANDDDERCNCIPSTRVADRSQGQTGGPVFGA